MWTTFLEFLFLGHAGTRGTSIIMITHNFVRLSITEAKIAVIFVLLVLINRVQAGLVQVPGAGADLRQECVHAVTPLPHVHVVACQCLLCCHCFLALDIHIR